MFVRDDRSFGVADCQHEVDTKDSKYQSRTSCDDIHYVVVLRPGKVALAKLEGDEYTPGVVDVDAFVFDMNDSSLLGGAHISARAPKTAEVNTRTATSDLETMLGKDVDEQLHDKLGFKK